MAEPKYFIQFHLKGDLATVELKTLETKQTLSTVKVDWIEIDDNPNNQALEALREQAITALRQCVVSANAAPGKIMDLQILVEEEVLYFGINKTSPSSSFVINNFDSFDEQLQQTIDLTKLLYKKEFRDFQFMPLHAWLAMQFSSEKNAPKIVKYVAETSIFYHPEKNTWHTGALKSLKINEYQLPTIVDVGDCVSLNEIGLVTSVAEIQINFQ